MILDNTQDKFKAMADKWGKDDPETFKRELRSILNRVLMDTRNHISRNLTDLELEITNLPFNRED